MGDRSVKVLYIMGHGGSGSTILGNVLGELDGFFHVGELDTLWEQGLSGKQVCGCGLAFEQCEVWSTVLKAALADAGRPIDAADVHRWHREAVRIRYAPLLLRLRPERTHVWAALDDYVDVLSRLYRSLSEFTSTRVIVDSSKRSGDASILRLVPGIDPYLLHLVRDPRAVAHSWHRRTPGRPPLPTSASWLAFNAIDELARARYGPRRSMLIRYEDFIARPQATVEAIERMVGERSDAHPFSGPQSVRLSTNHTTAGHWRRFSMGEVELKEDDEWRTSQARASRGLVTAISLPGLVRYGYPIRVGHDARGRRGRSAR